MAVATVTVTPLRSWVDGMYHVFGTVAVSASADTYATGGLTMALNNALIKAQRTPQFVRFTGINGYEYAYINGSDNTNGKLKILTTAATELAAAAVPAGVSGDTITFEAVFLGQN